jgi:hypothetical protein
VGDLALCVQSFLGSWRGEVSHPLSRWSLREMQEQHSYISAADVPGSDDVPSRLVSASYGFGLVVEDDRRLGRVVSHSGGYPGFGSHMRWHPDSGWGVVVLGNRTYTPAHKIGLTLLASLVESERAGHRPDPAATVWPRVREAQDVVDRLVDGWDDALADAWFAPNVDLDRPRAERRAAVQAVRARIGAFTRSPRAVESSSPAQLRWWLDGAEGTAYAEVLLSPDRVPLIQSLTVSTDPVPDSTWD